MNTERDVFSVNHITFPAAVNKTQRKMEKRFKLEALLKQKLSALKEYETFFLAFILVPAGRSVKNRERLLWFLKLIMYNQF